MTNQVASEIKIDAAVDDVMKVLCDFEGYMTWARGVKSVNVLDSTSDGRPETVEFELAPGPLPTVRYVLSYRYTPTSLEWDYVRGDLNDLTGAYRLSQQDDSTLVRYELSIDPGHVPLPGFLKARAAREITKVALNELKRRVETAS